MLIYPNRALNSASVPTFYLAQNRAIELMYLQNTSSTPIASVHLLTLTPQPSHNIRFQTRIA